MITEAPAELVEDIWLSPGIWPNCTSSGAVTGGRHHLGAGARVEGLHLDRRVIDLGKRRKRQEADRRTMPTSMIAAISNVVGDRAQNERARRAHYVTRPDGSRTSCAHPPRCARLPQCAGADECGMEGATGHQ